MNRPRQPQQVPHTVEPAQLGRRRSAIAKPVQPFHPQGNASIPALCTELKLPDLSCSIWPVIPRRRDQEVRQLRSVRACPRLLAPVDSFREPPHLLQSRTCAPLPLFESVL